MALNAGCIIKEDKLHPDYISSSDSDSDPLLSSTEAQTYYLPRHPWWFLPWALHGLSIVTCVALLVYTKSLYNVFHKSCLERNHAWCQYTCLSFSFTCKSYSKAAPMLGAIDGDYQDVFWNGSLWYHSPYKGPPTPEVNKAWHDLMQCIVPFSSPAFLP